MGKSLATIDGIARDIYPELDPIQSIKPHILQIYFQRLTDPEFYTRETQRAIEEGIFFLQRLPRDLRIITSKLRDGKLTVKLDPEGAGLDKIVKERDRGMNRLSVSIIIVGFLGVACYLMTNAYSPSFYSATANELSYIGKAMFATGMVAGAIGSLSGLGYLYGYLRSGGP
jgi:ubiquinone biosynthesis protein